MGSGLFGCVWVAPRSFESASCATSTVNFAQFFEVFASLPRLLICGFSVRFQVGFALRARQTWTISRRLTTLRSRTSFHSATHVNPQISDLLLDGRERRKRFSRSGWPARICTQLRLRLVGVVVTSSQHTADASIEGSRYSRARTLSHNGGGAAKVAHINYTPGRVEGAKIDQPVMTAKSTGRFRAGPWH